MAALTYSVVRNMNKKFCKLLTSAIDVFGCHLRKISTLNDSKPAFGLLFDIDGVIVRGKRVLPSAPEAFKKLVDKEGRFKVPTVFVTNAGNALRHDKASQLSNWLGVEIHEDQVVMAHSPLRMFRQYHKKRTLISGQGPIVEIAHHLGFKEVVTLEEMRSAFPALDAVDHKRRISVKVIKAFEKGEPFITPGKYKNRPRSVTGIDNFSKEALGRFIYNKLNQGSATYSWNKPEIVHGKPRGVMWRPAEGGRLVILHAGSKDGFVPGADLIFASNLKSGQDYHGAMNSETFQKWLEKQLVVGLRSLGPCLVVMDNASYHNKLTEQQPTSKWGKDQLMTWLRQNGVAVPDNANKNELHQLCKMNQNHLKRYVVDEILAQEGHTVLRLPPYHSFFSAIELVWSVTKNYYNKTEASWPGHGLDRVRVEWKEALSQVTAEMWRNEVKHTENIIMKYYNEEVRNAPEVEEFVIDLRESNEDSLEEDEEEEDLAIPLESIAATLEMN